MDVPIEFRAGVEAGVGPWEEVAGYEGGQIGADEMVCDGSKEELVDVNGEGGETQGFGQGSCEANEQWGRRYRKRIMHFVK